MAFAQLTWREGLRDIVERLNARPTTLYHLGFSEPVAKSTLADANEQSDGRLHAINFMRFCGIAKESLSATITEVLASI